MKDWIPLFQTGLWVALILFVCIYFKKQLSQLINTLSKRVESGDSIKVGSFELGQSVKPIDPAERDINLEKEVSEAIPSIKDDQAKKEIEINKYLKVEDAVLSSIQAEYGVLINRQVSAGDSADFDGFFVADGQPFGIEIKYVPGMHLQIEKYVTLAETIHKRIRNLGWKKFTLLFVIVFDEHDQHFRAGLKSLRRALNNIDGQTLLRSYRYEHLENRMQSQELSANKVVNGGILSA